MSHPASELEQAEAIATAAGSHLNDFCSLLNVSMTAIGTADQAPKSGVGMALFDAF